MRTWPYTLEETLRGLAVLAIVFTPATAFVLWARWADRRLRDWPGRDT